MVQHQWPVCAWVGCDRPAEQKCLQSSGCESNESGCKRRIPQLCSWGQPQPARHGPKQQWSEGCLWPCSRCHSSTVQKSISCVEFSDHLLHVLEQTLHGPLSFAPAYTSWQWTCQRQGVCGEMLRSARQLHGCDGEIDVPEANSLGWAAWGFRVTAGAEQRQWGSTASKGERNGFRRGRKTKKMPVKQRPHPCISDNVFFYSG